MGVATSRSLILDGKCFATSGSDTKRSVWDLDGMAAYMAALNNCLACRGLQTAGLNAAIPYANEPEKASMSQTNTSDRSGR
jgi:hypothetical protein